MAAPGKKKYVPAVTPRLKKLLAVVFALTALIGANSVYLASITFLEWASGQAYQNFFYQYMFLAHLVLGLLLTLPFLVFAALHLRNAWRRKNRRAVWMGYALLVTCLLLLGTGFLLTRAGVFEVRDATWREVFYWIHVVAPLAAVWLYILHRLAGPPIRVRVGLGYVGLVAAAAVAGVSLHQSDPRAWYQEGSPEGTKYFEPSLARTASGKFIPEQALVNDAYCQECHPDVHAGWAASAHRFSSFNNPAYLVSVRETRAFSIEREGTVRRSRWCAGCHDPAPFFTGQFDDPDFDDVHHPTAHAGITCTSCHAITHVNSVRGNADYTIEEPLQYPFAYSNNAVLQWINRQLVKAKPAFHRKTFLKPFHREAEFCSVCHKVHLPEALNDYTWLRGQNHYDSYLLSGVSGHGARSFYYPPHAHENCNRCHMPLAPSDDFAARRYEGSDERSIHDHLFVGANTALPHWRGDEDAVARHQKFLADCVRVDVFGLRGEARIDGALQAPLRPDVPILNPGGSYLVEIVLRTLTLGHHFTQGTVDSNEVWLQVRATDEQGREIGVSGMRDERGAVDPQAHFVNAFLLDREGNRINRRNAQDIFVPLYNHQIPPGAGQSVHYRLQVPPFAESVTIEANLLYRKFDQEYVEIIAKNHPPEQSPYGAVAPDAAVANDLPVTTLASDRVELAVGRSPNESNEQAEPSIPAWQRWNDYGIGLLLKGTAELRQAEAAFEQVEQLGRYDGPLNLARVFLTEGRLDDAVAAIERASAHTDPAPPPWTLAWLSGEINRQQGRLMAAEENLRAVLAPPTAAMRKRGLDFRNDYVVRNLLGQVIFERSRRVRGAARADAREKLQRNAVAEFQKTLSLDPENADAHYNLQLLYVALGEDELAEEHRKLHLKYKTDDNARDRAVAAARAQYPAANHAAEAVVIYELR